ncbi:short-chain dehydrogenase/reductase [Glonium stellatum]|uniref:Short-chain dehydrogenase/reductase n=1 Tax=Glonium stellatum TaxID=574774 RepID=A0A8E2F3Z1_9PEZI|nr:short-chain dehydrogenase/reductase [Glonium stellatum]
MAPWIFRFFYSQWFVTPPYPTESWAGKTVIVTGANVGLGLEAARHFARLGAAKVIIASRSTQKAETAKKSIQETTKCKPDVLETWLLDLCSYDSVKAFAERCNGLERIDAIVENAGVVTQNFKLEEEDETTITTNVVSTFLLALLVLPKLRETAKRFNTRPNLVIISSEVHFVTNFPEYGMTPAGESVFTTLADPGTARMADRYNVSKMMEVLACREIVATRAPKGYPVTINFVNPGLCHSELMRERGLVGSILKFLLHARSTEVGSRTLVSAASIGHESHGEYLSDCIVTAPSKLVTSPLGKEMQVHVWKHLSEKLERIQPGILNNF